MLELAKLQIASIALASILAAYVATASFTTQGAIDHAPPVQYADAAHVDYFLKIDGIDGESTSDMHKGEIDILSFSWSAAEHGTTAGGGAGAGKVSFQDLHFTKKIDKSSPKLMLACATGEHIREVVLTGEVSGKKGQKFMEIKLSDVLVSSFNQSGSSGDVPAEKVSLNFAKIAFTYYPVNPDGSLGKPVTGGWNVKENSSS
jgi:type VI secretion system secreted protein Hcp